MYFYKEKNTEQTQFQKKQHTQKTPDNKNVGWVRFLWLLQSILSSQIHSKIIFWVLINTLFVDQNNLKNIMKLIRNHLPGIIFYSFSKEKKRSIYIMKILTQVLNFGFRCQNKSKYLRSKLKNETQKLTTLQKSYKLISEELKFPYTVVFVPWISD